MMFIEYYLDLSTAKGVLKCPLNWIVGQAIIFKMSQDNIYAEVVTRVAGSLEAEGLPGYPESLIDEINVLKSWQSFVALYFTHLMKTRGLKLYTKRIHVLNNAREKNG